MPVTNQNTITIFVNATKDLIPIEGSIPTKDIVEFILGLTRMDLNNYVMENIHKLHSKNYREYNLYDYDFLLKGFHFNKDKFSHQKFYKIHFNWNGKFVEAKIDQLFPFSQFTPEYVSEPLDLAIDLRSEIEKNRGFGE